MCTCGSFGQKYQKFRRYRFVARYRIVGVLFTKLVVLCAAMGKWRARQPLLSAKSSSQNQLLTKSVLHKISCIALDGEIIKQDSRTAPAESGQHTNHGMRASMAQASVFWQREHRFELKKLYLKKRK